ncbi:MAG: helix-turn-helix domain-containing protein, partial [Oligoflexia bacterium]|nr:helix-turn-helix domain-containing protein [Oligoflexia bacterium]
MSINSTHQIKIDLISGVIQGKIPKETVMKALKVSERTIWRYIKKYRDKGIAFIKHGNWNTLPKNKSDDEEKKRIIEICKLLYYDFNRSHAYEKLIKEHSLVTSYSTFNRWCNEKEILKKKTYRRKKISRQRRERMKNIGIMIQMDGSHHQWFGFKKTCLIIAIDDANNEIIAGK